MARTYIIGERTWQPFAEYIGADLLEMPGEQAMGEKQLHDWMVTYLVEEVGLLIMQVDLNITFCMDLAMHVRLSREQLGDGCLCPVVFVSDLPLASFIRRTPYSQIFLTEKVYLCPPSEVPRRLDDFEPLTADSFRGGFLDRISVPRPEGSNHSLANQWGASRLFQLIRRTEIPRKDYKDFADIQKELYYKYMMNRIRRTSSRKPIACDAQVPGSAMKRILLIDDEADKGWSKTIESIFQSSRFDPSRDVVNERVPDYESLSQEARRKIESGEYDLFLLDLRLNGAAEDGQSVPEEFSGYKVLKRIKELNRGNQVIMLTASNKAWNLKALLSPLDGASGYFVKESPEYEFSDTFSVANLESFKEDAAKCFDRAYLRSFESFLKTLSTDGSGLMEKVHGQLEIAFEMASNASSGKMYQFAFLSAYQALELLTSDLTQEVESKKKKNQKELWIRDADGELKPALPVEWDGLQFRSKEFGFFLSEEGKSFSQRDKVAAIYLRKPGQDDRGLVYLIWQMILIRNEFIHRKATTNFDYSRPMNDRALIRHPDFQNSKLVFSDRGFAPLLQECCRKGCLYDGGHPMIEKGVIESSLGIRIMLECLMRVITALKQ